MTLFPLVPQPLFCVETILFMRRLECRRELSFREMQKELSGPGNAAATALLIPEKGPLLLNTLCGSVSLPPGQAFLCPFPGPKSCQSPNGAGFTLTLLLFSCAPAPHILENRGFPLGGEERTLLQKLFGELSALLESTPSGCGPRTGCSHLIRLYLEELLICLTRQQMQAIPPGAQDPAELSRILRYLNSHLDEPLSIGQICRDNLIGRARLAGLFHSAYGCGVISFFTWLKIRRAQEMIRDGRLNFSQIADALGYASVQYFSRRFRQIAGLTPSGYAAAVRKGGQIQKVPAPGPPRAGSCREL